MKRKDVMLCGIKYCKMFNIICECNNDSSIHYKEVYNPYTLSILTYMLK